MKTGYVKRRALVEGLVKEESKGELIWKMCFLYKYEHETLKPVEVTLRGKD
jgi:hypothetical protein